MFEVNLHYVARAGTGELGVFLERERVDDDRQRRLDHRLAGKPMQAAYGAAKAGLASLARSVGASTAETGFA